MFADPRQLRGMLISVPSALGRSVSGVQARWGALQGMAATAIGAATVATSHARLLGLDALSHGGFVHEAGLSPRCTELCATARCRHATWSTGGQVLIVWSVTRHDQGKRKLTGKAGTRFSTLMIAATRLRYNSVLPRDSSGHVPK